MGTLRKLGEISGSAADAARVVMASGREYPDIYTAMQTEMLLYLCTLPTIQTIGMIHRATELPDYACTACALR